MKSVAAKAFGLACLAALAGFLFGATPSSAASVSLTPLGGANYEVTLTPLTFTLTSVANNGARYVVIEDFYTSNVTGAGTYISGNINWSLNGGASVPIAFVTNTGVFGSTVGQVDPNDLLFNFSAGYATATGSPTLSAGDTITVSTTNMVFSTTSSPLASQPGPFTAYLTTFAGTLVPIASAQVDGSTTVPIPAALPLLVTGVFGLGVVGWRRRTST